ncbi:MAG: hypothetical protein ACD_4C00344G0001 [uncultured bacterium (gcode 4)]|uniref:Uncharacterized protein n=1 Tax=uncultured bacterium (gcode 4) TaxID=1234023 RepID=K2F5A8_9BACT|nr:MAG: hypothetical protein ACD_4C00344G0001 [uncultured bacterium (gcode 4)]
MRDIINKIFNVIFLYLFLTLTLLSGLGLLVLHILKIAKPFPWIQNWNYITIVFTLFFSLICFYFIRKKEKYILLALGLYWSIFLISFFLFYFLHFNKDLFELKEVNDNQLITKYQNEKISDKKNIYFYLKSLNDKNYFDNKTAFWKNKQKLDKLNEEQFQKSKPQYENIFYCYILIPNEDLCNWLSLNNYLNTLTNTGKILEETNLRMDTLKLINKNKKYKRDIWDHSLVQSIIPDTKTSSYYLINYLEKWDNKKIVNYFSQNYKLSHNVLNWDIYLPDYITFATTLSILNSQFEYILNNYKFTKDEINELKNILISNFKIFNVENIYANTFKYEYQDVLHTVYINWIWNGNIEELNKTHNFIFDIPLTIKTLKNIFYYWYIKRDKNINNIMESKNVFNLIRYNISWNILNTISYLSFNWYFDSLNDSKNQIDNLISKLEKEIK